MGRQRVVLRHVFRMMVCTVTAWLICGVHHAAPAQQSGVAVPPGTGKREGGGAAGLYVPRQDLQRMHVGLLLGSRIISFERVKEDAVASGMDRLRFRWYAGDLTSGACTPFTPGDTSPDAFALPLQPYGREKPWESPLMRRWRWKEGRFWFSREAMYNALAGRSADLTVLPPPKIEAIKPAPPEMQGPSSDRKLDRDAGQITEYYVPPVPFYTKRPDGPITGQELIRLAMSRGTVRMSGLVPLDVYLGNRWNKTPGPQGFVGSHTPRERFQHERGGFDVVPRSANTWTLFMLIHDNMFVWDCQSHPFQAGSSVGWHNTWKLQEHFSVPWRGQFFVVEVDEETRARYFDRRYVLIRDCGEVYELRPTGAADRPWRVERLLSDVDYLIALIYVEPEGAVYGFGPNFWVRLDTAERLRKTDCGDVTPGAVSFTDEDGAEHEIGRPFRTVWQCANVLYKNGVITTDGPQEGENR